MTLEDELLALVRKANAKGCVDRLRGVPERERTKAAARMLAVLAAANDRGRDPKKQAWLALDPKATENDAVTAARLAVLGTAPDVGPLRKLRWRAMPNDGALAVAVLRDRRPDWLARFVDVMAPFPMHWETLRALVREGLCPTPTSDDWVLGMIHAASSRRWTPVTKPTKDDRPLFDRDPQLLEREVWRVFEVEGNARVSLTGRQGFWQRTLVELAKDGRMDRGRMLDCTLQALARDFPQHKAGFYSRLHDALEPTPAELSKRASAYVGLLASRISPTVSLATRALDTLAGAGLPLPSGFVDAAASASAARARGSAITLVRMLGLVRGRDRERALLTAISFLEHGAADVVDAVLELLETHAKPTAELVAAVSRAAGAAPASRRARLQAWLEAHDGKPVATARAKKSQERPSRVARPKDLPPADVARAVARELERAAPEGPWPRVLLDGVDPPPRLDPGRRVEPVASHEELFDEAVRAVEAPADRVAVERLLDGVSRMGTPLDALPADRVKALRARAEKLSRRDPEGVPGFVVSWLGKAAALPPPRWEQKPRVDPATFGERRFVNVLARVAAGRTRPLLSMPSVDGFFVDPRALVARAVTLSGDLDVEDAVLALLRLAPDGRAEALAAAKALRPASPLARPLRYALGAPAASVKPKTGDDPALWIAAARARSPGADDPLVAKTFPGLGPDAGEAARFAFEWTKTKSKYVGFYVDYQARVRPLPKKKVPLAHLSVLMATGFDLGIEATARELASFMPADRRSFFAHGAVALRSNVDWSDAKWENHHFLEPLLDPDVPLEPIGLLVLAIGLNTKESRENALATDALVAAISDGRVVGPELGPPMASLWNPLQDGVKYVRRPIASRWAKTLLSVARTSPHHVEVTRRICESLFSAPPATTPPDLVALLEAWLELCEEAETGVADERARAFLEKTEKTTGGKAKTAAKRLLALPLRPSALAAEAHALALEGRWARAARWASWRTTKKPKRQ
jgi:hypothetical protein